MSEQDALLAFVREKLLKDPASEVTSDTPLFEERLLDSMNILNLIGYIENRLGRRLTDDEIVMSNFRSVRAMSAAFLYERPD